MKFNKLTKLTGGVILGLVLITGGFLMLKNSQKSLSDDARPVVRIGVIAPLSGDNAEVANNVKTVLLSYLDGYTGDIKYQLIFEDDVSKVKNIAPIVNKLVGADKVDGIITILAYVGMTAAPIAAREKIPHINIGSNPELADNKFNFLNYTPPHTAGEKMFELLAKNKYKNFAMVHMDHVGPAPYARELKKLANDKKMKYWDYTYQPVEKDFRMILADLRKNNPDVIILMALPPSIDVFRKQMLEAGLDIPVTSNHKKLFEGVLFVENPDGEDDFVNKVRNELHIDNMFLLAFAEDSLKIFIKVTEDFYKEHGVLPTREQIAEQIGKLKNFQGSAGTYSMGPDGVTQSKAVFKKIINGKPVMVKE